ncbi:MAG: hypothetical protein AUH72_05200 [Acidobacteria bacterium 13_1_40CM_4_65_8]|nr:MAG: hypothetical protein AUH72_05200 [Acidobacteria bacterium 13_1_40CM_4_65_8]
MALLDRFRTHPRQKHPDPAIRLAFVQEIPIDERELLAEIAREDADARVRRAAVAKLMDVAALAGVAKNDADEGVRAQAVAMLRDLALESFEGMGETESLAAVEALDALSDVKTLAAIAKSAPREPAALRALGRVSDTHSLGSIARHAEHEAVRRAAFEALQDHHEILAVALNSEFKDPTLAAVERITDRDELEQIAARAKNKSASKRARAIVREMDERAAQEAADAAAARADAAVKAAEAAAEAAAQPPPPDPAALERAAREADDRQAAADRARVAEVEAAERVRLQEEAAARRRADEETAARARVEAAEEAARRESERRHGRLTELATEAEAAAADADLAAARRRLGVARREWKDLSAGVTVDADLQSRFAAADATFVARDTAAHEEDQRARREALTRLQQMLTRIEALAARPELTLKAGERALRDVRTTLGSVPPLPSKREFEEIVRRLKAAQSALMPKVQELRDVADWQRWANVGIQEQLCEKMEALKALEDPEDIAHHVRDLQQQWRQAADVPRAQGEALWRRFKTAHDEVWARCEAHFAAQAGVRAENLAKKIALCERAEALAGSTAWIQTADEIKKLQADWKTIGPVTRGQEKTIWERFRSACDRFFTRRHADLAQRKAMWAENLAKKDALCAKAEALAESTDWEVAAAEIKRLQNEWKTIGPVKKTRSEAIWQRFRGACDHFFSRYAQRHDIERGERVAAREAIVAELETLAGLAGSQSTVDSPPSTVDGQPSTVDSQPSSTEAPPPDLLATVRGLRGRWQSELAARGVDRERAAALDERFAAAFKNVVARWPSAFSGTDLDPDANRRRMETIVKRMEDLASSLAGPALSGDAAVSPTTRLAAMLKEALAANTIGGKADEDSRLRAAAEEVRQAQQNFSRIGVMPDHERRALTDRFQRAIRRISERAGQAGRAGGAGWAGAAGRR